MNTSKKFNWLKFLRNISAFVLACIVADVGTALLYHHDIGASHDFWSWETLVNTTFFTSALIILSLVGLYDTKDY